MLRRLLRRLRGHKFNPKALAIQPNATQGRKQSRPNYIAS